MSLRYNSGFDVLSVIRTVTMYKKQIIAIMNVKYHDIYKHRESNVSSKDQFSIKD